MDALRSLEGINTLLGIVNASLTDGAVTVTLGNAIGGTSNSNAQALLDGIFLPKALSAAAKTPVYVAPDGVSVLGSVALPLAPALVPYAGVTQNGQSNVGAYGQAAIVVFGVQLQRTLGQPLTIQQIFNPGTNQLDGGGNSLKPSTTLTGVAITSTSGAFSCTAPTVPLTVGQQVTISGTWGGTGSITTPAYANPTTFLVSAVASTTAFTLTDLSGAAIVSTTGTPTGVTYTVTDTFAGLTPAVGAIVGPISNIDKSGVILTPGGLMFPNIPENFIPFAYAVVNNQWNSGATFTFGTTNWNANNLITATLFNAAHISKRERTLLA